MVEANTREAPTRIERGVICLDGQINNFCQAPLLKIFLFPSTPNQLYKCRVLSRRGALAIVTNVGAGCGGRGSVGYATWWQGGVIH